MLEEEYESEIQKERVGQRSPVYVVSHHHMIIGLMTWLRKDKAEALHILENELKMFSQLRNDLYREMTHPMSLDNFRENEQLSKYGDMVEARGVMMTELKKVIEANPVFNDKFVFPSLRSSRLPALINQRYGCKFVIVRILVGDLE
ncbi:hypothetical protein ACET3Z_031846 [Daucus carota]